MKPEDISRRRAAKRFNERLKLLATFFNNTGIATLVGGLVLPLLNGAIPTRYQIAAILTVAAVSHISAQLLLSFFRSED